MATLKTNYKDDILNTAMNNKRRYTEEINPDGTKSFTDSTQYSQVGDQFGANDINNTNTEVNRVADELLDAKNDITQINNDLTELSDYSYEEVAVGKWVDGKTLYKKSFNWAENGISINSILNGYPIFDANNINLYKWELTINYATANDDEHIRERFYNNISYFGNASTHIFIDSYYFFPSKTLNIRSRAGGELTTHYIRKSLATIYYTKN